MDPAPSSGHVDFKELSQCSLVDFEELSQRDAKERKDVQTLVRAAMDGNWKTAKEIMDTNPDLATAGIQIQEGMSALLLAAKCGKSEFVVNLVSILTADDLEMMVDNFGNNALHHAAANSDVRAARAIVQKNPDLTESKNAQNFTPLFYAASWRHPSKSKEMLEFLFEKTRPSVYNPSSEISGDIAPALVVAITASGCHGIALKILQKHPILALARNEDKWSILHMLATQPLAFSGGRKTSLLCRWMNFQATMQQGQGQTDALKLVHFVCQQLMSFNIKIVTYFLPDDFEHAILSLATVHGASELVKVCLQYFPDLIWYVSKSDKKTLLHVAVEHRRVEIYNLVMRLIGENAGYYSRMKVDEGNILHLAAKLAPTPQLHSVPGPAFQMQRELQWFKAVQSIVYTDERHAKSGKFKPEELFYKAHGSLITDAKRHAKSGEFTPEELFYEAHGSLITDAKRHAKSGEFTPEELFYEAHGSLITDAKNWMKDISNSCMVVAALVATVAFASMITVPGGSNNDTGMPILSKQKVFVVFSVANATSMISSAIALLMFLSLQTSRYTNEDFLESLPKNLVRGLLALFVAVATMMLAFGTAIGLALETRMKWAYILITVVACIPVIIFTRLHLPLLAQTVKVSSGPVISGQRRSLKRQCLNKICNCLVPHGDDLV